MHTEVDREKEHTEVEREKVAKSGMVGSGGMRGVVLEDVGIVGVLVGVQSLYAANSEVMSRVMSLGVNSYSFVIFSTFFIFLLLAPLSIYFERSKWPKKLSSTLFIQLLLVSFGGVTLFQTLFLKGLKLTSPAMGTAMPNLAPGFIFVIAWVFRLERVDLSCTYSRVKIVGTLLCVIGAVIMSIMHSATSATKDDQSLNNKTFDREKLIGCIYLMAAVLTSSSTFALQAATLGNLPAPMSLGAVTSLIGVFTTAIVQLIQEHKIETSWPLVSVGALIAYSVLGGAIVATCLSFSLWAIEKRGPIYVSMFGPIGSAISVIISVITLKKLISLGSLAGMLILFVGLYLVLWAKKKESVSDITNGEESLESTECDVEKPLLS